MREKNTNPFVTDSTNSRALFEPSIVLDKNTNPFVHENEEEEHKKKNKPPANASSDCEGGLGGRSMEELEGYAVLKAEETTQTIDNCLKIAVNMREDAGNTLASLHMQGEQITKTHLDLVDLDQNLTRGEKLLGSLGGLFSRTWKPKRNREIQGPRFFTTAAATTDDPRPLTRAARREHWGVHPLQPKPDTGIHKVEAERGKQEDALSEISNILGDLKMMAVDMGSEIRRQNRALGHLDDDVDELNLRVHGANDRGRRLLRK